MSDEHIKNEPVRIKFNRTQALKTIVISAAAVLIGFVGAAAYLVAHPKPELAMKDNTVSQGSERTANSSSLQSPAMGAKIVSETALKLDETKQYGDKYGEGLVPVGDGKYVTDAPKQGYIFACRAPQAGAPGAGARGPWFVNANTQYDAVKKVTVAGSVSWESKYVNQVNGDTRTITTNDVPNNHMTGVFPISRTDAAYTYDKNPNSIKEQAFTYKLPVNPALRTPTCVGGEVGIMTTGVALFSAFDAGGRDAGAWEAQDGCSGHPQKSGAYHYHTLSSCIKSADIRTVIGYALDGLPITGPKISEGNILTTADLDECHGITSNIMLDGALVTSYHYVMTQDFPYSVSCFRATGTQSAT